MLGFQRRRLASAASWALLWQRRSLVNVRLKWVKGRSLDRAVSRERHLPTVHSLLESISSHPRKTLPSSHLPFFIPRLLLPESVRRSPSDFLRWFPSLFREHTGRCRRRFGLTEEALDLRREELLVLRSSEPDLVDRLCKLLMLTRDRSLPVNAVNQLRWDLGLPSDYLDSLLPRHPDRLRLVRLPEGGGAVDLVRWDDRLAVSELQRNADPGADAEGLAFPIRFTRGFGLKKKCVSWLQEWQTLPYTSPYADASCLDPRTDVSEKRIVGVFHELLHLTLAKKTRRANLSHLRQPLSLPFKFTKVFGRHPGIFYVSQKLATHTIVLREAYGGGRELIQKHPLVGIRERYLELMRKGCIDNKEKMIIEGDGDGRVCTITEDSDDETE